jgi:hypothetical protein
MKQNLKPFGHLLQASPSLHRLLSEIRSQQLLLQRVRGLLPAPLPEHCISTILKERRLVIYVDSSAWASRVRFLSRELTRRLASEQLAVEKVSVRVMLQQPKTQQPQPSPRGISSANARILGQMAEGISDNGLREALMRLRKHQR